MNGTWWDHAACIGTDPEAFYPEKGGSPREAKSVCAWCPVKPECLDWALRHGEKGGIWGGLSYNERLRWQLAQGQVAS